ncbi:MAG: PKD domain-containing protein, partial [Gammaproteobacteria bacterium]
MKRPRRKVLLPISLAALLLVVAQVVLAVPPENVSFTVSDATPNRGQNVNFNASTATDPDGGTITSYAWDFGDGTTGSGPSVSHTYAAGTPVGPKTVTLTVTDSDNETTSTSQQVDVQNAPPTASFTVSDTTPNAGQTVNFNGSASSDFEGPIADTNHDWDLDGNGSFETTGKTPSRSYSTPGPVTVTLQVTDSNGASDTATQTITVNNVAPTARFTISPSDQAGGAPGVPDVGETVNFNGSTSDAGEASDSITKYEWDLDGNGTFEVNTGNSPFASRPYSVAGDVDVKLRVTDSGNGMHTATSPNLTVNGKPDAGIQVLTQEAEPGQKIDVPLVGQPAVFDGSPSTDLNGPGAGDDATAALVYRWDFDNDGQFGEAGEQIPGGGACVPNNQVKSAVCTFNTAGNKVVGLRVIDNPNGGTPGDGAVDDATLNVRVNAAPVPGFSYEPLTPVIGDKVTFRSTSFDPDDQIPGVNEQITYAWAFDLDNNNSFETNGGTGPIEERTFSAAGTYGVKLTVTDTGLIKREIVRKVLVQNTIPKGGFTWSPNSPLPGQPVTFSGAPSVATAGKSI